MSTFIHHVAVVTTNGAKTYTVGDKVNGKVIDRIGEDDLYRLGDPYPHYIGYSSEGDWIFAVNALHAAVIEWA